MWGFMWMFWVMPFLFFFLVLRPRRWAMVGPGGQGGRGAGDHRVAPTLRREIEEQRSYIDGLETRLAELEERLDFTERLLAGRQEEPASRSGAART